MNLVLSEVEETILLVEGEEGAPAVGRLNASPSFPLAPINYFS